MLSDGFLDYWAPPNTGHCMLGPALCTKLDLFLFFFWTQQYVTHPSCPIHRCVFESWRCDGQVDCKDGTDELNCTVILPRKVITAATVGSLVCGLLLVIAMGCTCKLYSLRTREYR